VNLDTWLWLDNPPATESVTAAVAGSGAATVTARFAGMDITAPGESPLSCAGPGTALQRRGASDVRAGVRPGF